MPLTSYGKRLIAEAMYRRGKSFLAASVLLQQKRGHGYVVLHLKCQSIEVILKALLHLSDYDKYKGKARAYGHDLIFLADEASLVYGLNPMREPLRQELDTLNGFYKKHRLRYADAYELFIDPMTIPDARVAFRIVACLRLAERAFARHPVSSQALKS